VYLAARIKDGIQIDWFEAKPIANSDYFVGGAARPRTAGRAVGRALRSNVIPRSLQEWEQGRRRPESAVRAYLTVMDRNPEAVEKHS
jgi:hypothetical protein